MLNAAAIGDGSPSSRPKTLLIVEDNVLVRYATADALRYAGYDVLEASSADEAISILTAVSVDLLFVDVNVPTEGEGLAVARFARQRRPGMPVVFTSGRVSATLRAQLKEIGPFVPKPYLISGVIKMIGKKLSETRK